MDLLKGGCHVLWFGSLEGRVLDAVAVDFADVEVLFYGGDVGRWDAVGCSPGAGWGGGVLRFCQMRRRWWRGEMEKEV
jgi:hypothetical protein